MSAMEGSPDPDPLGRSSSPVPRARARIRPREPLLRRGLRRAPRGGLPDDGRPCASSAASASPSPSVMRETRRLAYWAPATALGTNMHTYWVGVASTLHGAGDSSLRLDTRGGRQGRGLRGRPRRGRQRPARSSSPTRRRSASTAAGGSSAGSRSAACRRSGPASDPRPGHERSEAPADRARVPVARREGLHHRADLGRAGDARDTERRHDPRRRVRARRSRGSDRAAGSGRARPLRPLGLRLGSRRLRATSTTGSDGAFSI